MAKLSIDRRTLKRSSLMAVFLLAVFLFLLFRVFAIQFFQFEHYQKKVIDQLTTASPVRAERGVILDSAGRVLAENRTVYRVSLFPNVIERSASADETRERIAAGLSEILSLNIEKVREHLAHKTALSRTVAQNLDTETANRVLRFIGENKFYEMIAVEAVTTRYYPYGSLAAHCLGFTGSDGQGLYGLELQYDAALRGKNGSYVTARDSRGNEMPNAYEAYIPAENGYTLYTTLDAYIQSVLERELNKTLLESGAKNRVCGIVMDVESGAILAMATAPSFDLNEPFALNAASQKAIDALGVDPASEEYAAEKSRLLLETWSNKAVTEIYMPGSTFKTLTCSMVLEEGAVTNLDERFFCSGALTVADRNIHCHKAGGHGSLTFKEGLQNSCNPVMMTIAARLGKDKFYQYVRNFGLLEKTGIDLPGEGNSIFHAPSKFTELDLATASFGQNFKVSLLQMISAVSAVANGGELLSPYLVERMTDSDGNVVYEHERAVRRRVISEKTAKTISAILEEGVSGDGGAKNAYVPGYRVAAKTGTSEKIGDDASARIGSCVGYAPADEPRVAVIIEVDEPSGGVRYGSVVAAPYLANVMEDILPYLGVEARYTEEEEENLTVGVPNCIGMTREEAEELLSEAGIAAVFSGEGDRVLAQSPAVGSRIKKNGASVSLRFTEEETTPLSVPDVVGKSAAEANRTLVDAGFNVAIEGARDFLRSSKNVAAQYPAPGVSLPRGSVVTVRFLYDEKDE